MRRTFVLLSFIYFSPLSDAHAQVTFDGCNDFRGISVASIRSNVDNVAIASLAPNGRPIIRWNPYVLSSFHPITRLFWYMHECAHHALGHTIGSAHPFVREKQADCWAIRTMFRRGMLDRRALRIIQIDLSNLPGDGWIYLPGPLRSISLEGC